jgi:hypothetical protein
MPLLLLGQVRSMTTTLADTLGGSTTLADTSGSSPLSPWPLYRPATAAPAPWALYGQPAQPLRPLPMPLLPGTPLMQPSLVQLLESRRRAAALQAYFAQALPPSPPTPLLSLVLGLPGSVANEVTELPKLPGALTQAITTHSPSAFLQAPGVRMLSSVLGLI